MRRLSLPLAAAGLLTALVPGVAVAQEFQLRWTAPEPCPLVAQVRADVVRMVGDGPHADTHPIAVDVIQQPSGFEASVRRGEGAPRTLRSDSCVDLSAAVAVVVALMINPEAIVAPSEAEPTESEPAEIGPGEPVNPTGPGPEETDPEEPRPDAGPDSSAEGSTAEDTASPPPTDDVVEPAEGEPPTEEHATPVRYSLGAGLRIDTFLFAGPWLKFALVIGEFTLSFDVYFATGTLSGPAPATTSLTGLVGGASFGYRLFESEAELPITLTALAGLEAGFLLAEASGISRPGDATAGHLGLTITAVGRLPISEYFHIFMDVGFTFPLFQPEFTIAPLGSVYQVFPVTLRGGVGIAVQF